MRLRVAVIAVALWLGVVLVGSGITWLVIGQVGRDVSGAGPSVEVLASGASSTTPLPSATPRASPRSKAPRPKTPVASSALSSTPSRVTPSPTASSGATPQTTNAPRTQRPVPAGRVPRTWVGTGGRVTASCTGSRVALESASPADGWRVEVGNRGPETVEVTFKRAESEVQVRARCNGGEPTFPAEGDD